MLYKDFVLLGNKLYANLHNIGRVPKYHLLETATLCSSVDKALDLRSKGRSFDSRAVVKHIFFTLHGVDINSKLHHKHHFRLSA